MAAQTTMTLRIAPVLRFRVLSARRGVVELEVEGIAAGDPPKRLSLPVGSEWLYDLTLNADGWDQKHRVTHLVLELPEAPRRGLGRGRME